MLFTIGKVLKSKLLISLLCFIIILPVIIPLFTSYVPGTADGMAHKFRVVSFGRSLSEGNIRPRWLADQALGYGSPIFLFNYIFPYYLVDGLTRLGFGINRATQIFEAITLIFSFLAMYLLGNKLWGRKAGIVAATVYAWAPYHLLTIYLYEGWGEMTAFIYPPLILYLIIRDQSRRNSVDNDKSEARNPKHETNSNARNSNFKKIKSFGHLILGIVSSFDIRNSNFILLILSWSLFILSHNVSALLFTPVIMLLAFLIVRFRLIDWIKVAILPFFASLVLTAFFWLPAISLNQLTNYPDLIAQEQGMRGSYFKSLSTIFSVAINTIKNNTSNFYDFTVGLPILVGSIIIATLAVKKLLFQKKRFWIHSINSVQASQNDLLIFTFVVILLLSLYLANYSSNWLWETITVFRFIVYPFRFLFVATFAGSLIVGYISRKNLIVALLFIVLAVVAGRPYTKPYVDIFPFSSSYFKQPQTVFYAPETKKNMATREFLPKWASIKFLEDEEKSYLDTEKLPEKFKLPASNGTVASVKINQEKVSALLHITQDTTLTVNTFYFPNWIAEIDGAKASLGKDISGRIVLPVSHGEHKIDLVFGKSNIEKIADIISTAGLTLLLILIIAPILQRRNPRN